MPEVKFVVCEPISQVLKRFHPRGYMYLEEHKARQMIKAGQVREVEIRETVHEPPKVRNIYLPVVIVYAPGQRVGYAYNREMRRIDDWVVFIDYDVLLLNPHWYDICVNAIDQVGRDAGWITCYTNRIGCRTQALGIDDVESHDIQYHKEIAKHMYASKRGSIRDITKVTGQLSGMFIMTNKRAWEAVGGFKESGFYGVDNDYSRRLRHKGFKLYLMEDLYVYHSYFRYVLKDGQEAWR
jgi:GT2 family glycosyltransferase